MVNIGQKKILFFFFFEKKLNSYGDGERTNGKSCISLNQVRLEKWIEVDYLVSCKIFDKFVGL